MGWLDRLFGRGEESRAREPQPTSAGVGGQAALSDEQALARYHYMLKTAPPEAIEQAHEEAFAKLTPDQRAQVLRELSAQTPESERAGLAGRDDPKSLARLATRAEMRQPGMMERTLGRSGGGMGGGMGGTIFASLVAGFAGSMIANQLFAGLGDADFGAGGADVPADAGQSADTSTGDFADSGADFGGDFGGDI